MKDNNYRPAPPEAALRYFRAKALKPAFDYRDVFAEEHAISFTVAKAMKMDVLDTLRLSLDQALAQGQTYRQFANALTPTLQKLGWWGKQLATDPLSGEEVITQLGSPRRLKIIYQTNLRAAYSAGQWERIQRTKASLPYLLYYLGPSQEHRQEHVNWHNTLLSADDDFWLTHMPANGWGCKCGVRQVSRSEAERLKKSGAPSAERKSIIDPATQLPTGRFEKVLSPVKTKAPPINSREWTNKRSGVSQQVPEGIDPGFAYNPGSEARKAHMARVFMNKLPMAQPEIAAEVMAQSLKFVLPELTRDFKGWVNRITTQQQAKNELKVIGALSPKTIEFLAARQQPVSSAAITLLDKDILHMLRDSKKQGGRALPVSDVLKLPGIIAKPQAILWDKHNPALVYVYSIGEKVSGKIVVRVHYKVKVRDGDAKTQRISTNQIATSGKVDISALLNKGYYEVIQGGL